MRGSSVDTILGCTLAIGFALVAVFVIPAYIRVPTSGISTVSPSFWPTVVSWGLAGLGILLAVPGLLAARAGGEPAGAGPGLRIDRPGAFRTLIAFTLMVSFYFLMPVLGIIAAAVPVFLGLAVLLDRKRWRMSLIVAVALPALLYLFFVKVAHVPLPLGLFT